jgi:LacI family transcriptional regulator
MPLPRVALVIETSNAYARGLLGGVQAYIRENKPWSIYLAEQARGDEPPAWLRDWKGDGILARIENPAIAKVIATLALPTVDLSAGRLLPDLPCFEIDERAVGAMAAEHFLERGFKHFAYCGDSRFVWSQRRGEAFAAALAAHGHTVSHYEPPSGPAKPGDDELLSLCEWLHGLPKPVAIFCCYDIRGRLVLDACRHESIAVPDRAAVLSVDNDELLCSLAYPPLSSIVPNAAGAGYQAAALLARMMDGETAGEAEAANPGPECQYLAPNGIVTRQSTDVLAVDDAQVARAVHYIREHACQGICVDDVVAQGGISRRLLEVRFKKLIGRSPHEEIIRVQILRVQDLLANTDLQLIEIADRAGFKYVEYLSAVFKQKVGIPPGKYRAQHRPARKSKD